MDIQHNLNEIRERIAAATSRSGRDPGCVTLIAVTKTVDAETVRQLAMAGQTKFGENRPQGLRDKSRLLEDLTVSWHQIGTLQGNKIKYVYPTVELVHSIDRRELLDEFAGWANKTGRKCPCLLEVHISDEETKHGFDPDEIPDFIESIRDRPGLDIRGMMGMAPFTDDHRVVRAAFKRLRELFDRSRSLQGAAYRAIDLSMGMSDDFEIAIEEGSTMVRIGRALFKD
ncbi:MAG: YggS family pyridoxal phosphate-dependent enzyme [Candidatus Riflebacteria bacterium]|nr:YggS family pyridoxal phosphate-dependent enzyme [Candidatus Riflebacteria bacterium]